MSENSTEINFLSEYSFLRVSKISDNFSGLSDTVVDVKSTMNRSFTSLSFSGS